MCPRFKLIQNDAWLSPHEPSIIQRHTAALAKEKILTGGGKQSLSEFANGYLYFGLHKTPEGWVIREWAPGATKLILTGEFNNWKEDDKYQFKKLSGGVWELKLAAGVLAHKMLYHLVVYWKNGKGKRIPAWTRNVHQDPETLIFNARVWEPEEKYIWKTTALKSRIEPPLIYEAHVGMSTEKAGITTYTEFKEQILPRIVKAGYNTIQLMAIQEHPYYGSFGYHVSSMFAASSRFGTPEELKSLIDTAHQQGLAVIMDIVHSHAVKNEVEGLGMLDGTPYLYFHDGPRRHHVAWDSLCFNYGKNEVLHFLLSNCKYWLEEFRFDGFRFDGVTSMIYYDHGLDRKFNSYDDYFNLNQDIDAIVYLMLCNKLIHQVNPMAITIAEEVSGMPGLGAPFEDGGFGFDYRMAMGTPDYWIKLIKEIPDEKWDVKELYYELTKKRKDEKTIGYAESHDQAMVGDQTIIFRLMNKEMYWNMNLSSQNLVIDRGMALHKMIRLITIATSGNGYLNFIGNEFGHPEWIDFPREGNNWSYHYARRQWNLADNPELRYHQLADFDRDMLTVIRKHFVLNDDKIYLIHENTSSQILAFERAELLFVFNFNPTTSFTDYGIMYKTGRFKIVLNTDLPAYGGQNRINNEMFYYSLKEDDDSMNSPSLLKLYLPARTAMVFKRHEARRVY